MALRQKDEARKPERVEEASAAVRCCVLGGYDGTSKTPNFPPPPPNVAETLHRDRNRNLD